MYINHISCENVVMLLNSKQLSVLHYCNSRCGVCCCFAASPKSVDSLKINSELSGGTGIST